MDLVHNLVTLLLVRSCFSVLWLKHVIVKDIGAMDKAHNRKGYRFAIRMHPMRYITYRLESYYSF